jgi:hypothetical protein
VDGSDVVRRERRRLPLYESGHPGSIPKEILIDSSRPMREETTTK